MCNRLGRARSLGSTQRRVVHFFQVDSPTRPPFIPSKWTLRNVNYNISSTWCTKKQLVTSHKRDVRNTTGLLSSDWSRITFIFRIQSVATLRLGRRLVSDEKWIRNCNRWVTHFWLMCDPFVTYLRPTYNPSITHPVIHLRPTCNHVWSTHDLSMNYL